MRYVSRLMVTAGGPARNGLDSTPIYLDYHATTPTDPRVADVVLRYLISDFANASSREHSMGLDAATAVADARGEIRKLVSATNHRVVFTSGATESINLAIKGYSDASSGKAGRFRIVVSPVEHAAVLDTCAALARAGKVEIKFLAVDSAGRVDLSEIKDLVRNADLFCLMAANNEIGNLYPVGEVGQICREAGVVFLCDASQAAGKVPLDAESVDLVALSSHKMYGPKGVGALLVGPDQVLVGQMHGGGHQRGLRSGTLNVPGIAGFGAACRLRRLEMVADERRIERLRDRLAENIFEGLPEVVVNGDRANRLAGNLHLSIPGVPNSAVIARLWGKLAISTGAACSSGVEAPSHVLRALRLSDALVEGAFRFGIGKFTTLSEIQRASELFVCAVQSTKELVHPENIS